MKPGLDRRGFCTRALGVTAALAAAAMGGGGAQAEDAAVARRPVPKSGELIPVVGVGTWQTFDIGSDAGERPQRARVLETLFAGGGAMIDSSPMYGRAEGVVGDLLAASGARARAFLATKVWTQGAAAGREQMEQSFRHFRTDRIDLMQIHNLVDWQSHLGALREGRAAGRLRYLGVTHYTPAAFDEVERVLRSTPFDFLQIPYSIAVPDAEARLLPLARDLGIAVIANRPFDGGDLFARSRNRPLPALAADLGCASWAQFFLKYILGHPAMTVVIPGTGRPEYMADNMGAGRGRFPDAAERRRMIAEMARL